MHDVPDGAVEELSVVGDDDDRIGIFGEVLFQPDGALKVEVVGRLVQKQEVGFGEEDRGQGHAHPPTA